MTPQLLFEGMLHNMMESAREYKSDELFVKISVQLVNGATQSIVDSDLGVIGKTELSKLLKESK